MSIPKEPRQLMINIMYLVLTAMLALNVSAEVMNAFFTLDDGNKASINTVSSQLDNTVKGVDELLKDPSKIKFQAISPAMKQVQTSAAEFNTYVDQLREKLIDEAGHKDGKVNDEDFKESYGKRVPKGMKNKDVTTRILVQEGEGEKLKKNILDTRDELIGIYTKLIKENGQAFGLKPNEIDSRIQSIANNMPFKIDDETWKKTKDKKSWSDFKFRQMPLAAVLPLMSQMQADLKSAEAAMINSMAEMTGGRIIEIDQFFPVVQAEKSYVIAGEPFNAEISIGSYSSTLDPKDVVLSVNGSSLRLAEDGKAKYSTTTSSTGPQTLNLGVRVTNPLTGEVKEGKGTYTYEVGRRSVAVSADKMNVFYIGVENPVSISAAGVATSELRVSASGGGINLRSSGTGKYTATVSTQGEATITVSGGGLKASPFAFRVKRIPDPVAKLSGKVGGEMGSGEFKAQGGLAAMLENFDFDAKCEIQGYDLTYQAARQDAVTSSNPGGRFNDKSQRLAQQAKPGDRYFFENVRARCPGDQAGRRINDLVFKIK